MLIVKGLALLGGTHFAHYHVIVVDKDHLMLWAEAV